MLFLKDNHYHNLLAHSILNNSNVPNTFFLVESLPDFLFSFASSCCFFLIANALIAFLLTFFSLLAIFGFKLLLSAKIVKGVKLTKKKKPKTLLLKVC